MKKLGLAIFIMFSVAIFVRPSYSHCEVPCGIYDDERRIHEIQEYILTIEKSMRAIQELSKDIKDPLSINQIVRWIDTKEKHCKKIQYIIWQYFFTQRVKPVDHTNHSKYEKYLKQLELLNKLNFYTMKAKQSVDIKVVDKLRKVLEEFEGVYFGKKHIEEHHHH